MGGGCIGQSRTSGSVRYIGDGNRTERRWLHRRDRGGLQSTEAGDVINQIVSDPRKSVRPRQRDTIPPGEISGIHQLPAVAG